MADEQQQQGQQDASAVSTADTAAPAATTAGSAAPAATSTDATAPVAAADAPAAPTAAVQTGSDIISAPAASIAKSEDPYVKEFLDLVGHKQLPEINQIFKAGIDALAPKPEEAPKEDNPLVDWAESISVKPFEGQDVKDAQAALQAHNEANQPDARM